MKRDKTQVNNLNHVKDRQNSEVYDEMNSIPYTHQC